MNSSVAQSSQLSSNSKIVSFLGDLREQRERLLALAAQRPGSADDLALAIDQIGEELLVADEELRAQNDELVESTHRLDIAIAAYEQLFSDAPIAWVQTDADGVLLRYNHAARRLFGLPTTTWRSRTLSYLIAPGDRRAFRGLVARVRDSAVGEQFTHPMERMETAVIKPDGSSTRVILSGRRSAEAMGGRSVLHWELHEPGRDEVTPLPFARPAASEVRAQIDGLVHAAAEIARQETPVATLREVVRQAAEAVSACDDAGIVLTRGRGRIDVPATDGELAAECDHLQQKLVEGPWPDAVGQAVPVVVTDVRTDPRWPRFAAAVKDLGVRSILALPLPTPRGVAGALTFYAAAADAFSADEQLIATAFATHAGIAIGHAELEANLRVGLQTREEIGRAVGILMERHRMTASTAFDMLVMASQHSHRKLRDVAAWMTETGEDPSSLLRRESSS